MTNGKPKSDESKYIEGIEESEKENGLVESVTDTVSLTPNRYEQLKKLVHGNDTFAKITSAEKRYLIIGRGRGEMRHKKRVKELLGSRRSAITFEFEEFKPKTDDIGLWPPVFDLFSKTATHIVGVVEDYDGGGVWDMGLLYHRQSHVHDSLWILKRVYDNQNINHERYGSGKAASRLGALEEAVEDRVIKWQTEEDLRDAVKEIP